jgi:NADH:ubiquinone oxidoreductase subunit C
MKEQFPDFSERVAYQYQGFKPLCGGHQIKVAPENAKHLLNYLFRNQEFWCDYLVSLSGEHLILEKEIVRIHYHLCSYTQNLHFHVWTEKEIESG